MENYVEINKVWLIDLVSLNGQAMEEFLLLPEEIKTEVNKRCPKLNSLFAYINFAESTFSNIRKV